MSNALITSLGNCTPGTKIAGPRSEPGDERVIPPSREGLVLAIVLVFLLMGGQLSIVAGTADHPDGRARRSGRSALDAGREPTQRLMSSR